MATTVTKENQEGINIFYSTEAFYKGTTRRREIRRTGATKFWKTRPNNFKIPVKYGMDEHGYIDQTNCVNWTID